MVKIRKSRKLLAFVAVCFTVWFTTCKNNIGMGGTVDINPPELDVSTIYPPAGSIIRDEFTLSIKATDDTGIASINVQLIKTGLTEQPDSKATSFDLTKADDGIHWTARVNKNGENGFALKDGSYKALLTATDTAGKTARTESTFTIDNTPPLLILSRPSTASAEYSDASADVFGDRLYFAGQVYDKSDVDKLTITAKDAKGNEKGKTTLTAIPQSMNMTVDMFFNPLEGQNKFYRTVYGDNTPKGKRQYSYTITVSDSARSYNDPEQKAGTREGNSTDTYYLYEELYQLLRTYKPAALYEMQSGVYMDDSTRAAENGSGSWTPQSALAFLQAPEHKLGGTRNGTFALNPSINPKYGIEGFSPKKINTEPGSTIDADSLYNGSLINVKLSTNFDEDPLNAASTYKFYLIDVEEYCKNYSAKYPNADTKSLNELLSTPFDVNIDDDLYTDKNAAELQLRAGITDITPDFSQINKSGSSYIASITLNDLSYSSRYVLQVRGCDQNSKEHTLIADPKDTDGGLYIFKMMKIGAKPEVSVAQINGKNPQAGRFYIGKESSAAFKAALKNTSIGSIEVKLIGVSGEITSEVKQYSVEGGNVHLVSFDIPKDKFAQDKSAAYRITIQAKDSQGAGDSLVQEYQLYYDVEGPVISANVSDSVTLMPNITGDIYDAGVGVDYGTLSARYKKPDGTEHDIGFSTSASAENGKWALNSLSGGEGKYKVILTAKDTLGNLGTKELEFTYDAAPPQITELKVDNTEGVRDGDTIYSNKDSVTVSVKAADTHGVKEVAINGYPGSLDSNGFWTRDIDTSSLPAGARSINIIVKDQADKPASATVTLFVDRDNPTFTSVKIGGAESLTSSASTVITTYKTPVTLEGTVTDTGSGVEKVEYSLNAADPTPEWTLLVLKKSGANYEFNGFTSIGVGNTETVTLRITDNAGNREKWTRTVKVVSTIPVFRLAFPRVPNGIDGLTTIRRGSFRVAMGCYVEGADGSRDIDDIIVKKDNAVIADKDNGYSTFFDDLTSASMLKVKDEIDTTLTFYTVKAALESGLYTITLTHNGISTDQTVIIDNDAPSITMEYPEITDVVGGTVNIRGRIEDGNNSAGVKKEGTKFQFVQNTASVPTADGAGWQPMKNSTAGSWGFEKNLDDIATHPSQYGTANANNSTYYDIPVYIRTEDNVGNTTVKKEIIVLNPNGKKPIVKVLSPASGAIVGGSIRIFGTSSVIIGTPADIGQVYLQFSRNGNFNNTADGTFGGVDWYNAGKGRVVTGTDGTDGGASWLQEINAGAGDPFYPADGKAYDVYFRLCAENKTALASDGISKLKGEWISKIKIRIDPNAPTIGSPHPIEIAHASGTPNAKSYVPNMWIGRDKKLTGSLYDDSGIKEVTITGDLENGTKYEYKFDAPSPNPLPAWIVEDTHPAHQPTVSGSTAKNYVLQLPVNLDNLSDGAKKKGEFKVKIRIVENTAEKLHTEQEFVFRFDTTDPFGDFGLELLTANSTFESNAVIDTELAGKLSGTGPHPAGFRLLANGQSMSVNGVTGNKIAFTPSIPAANYNYILYKRNPDGEIPLIRNGSNKWTVTGVAYDKGSGVEKVEAWVTVGSDSTGHCTMTETHPENRITKQLDGLFTWTGRIDLTVPNGKGKLHYIITDKSGNQYTAAIDVRVKNDPIQVTKVTLKTKIGGEDIDTTPKTADSLETDPVIVGSGDLNANLDDIKIFTSSNFAFKSKDGSSKIKVEWTSAQSNIKYRLKKSGGTVLTGHDLQPLTSGGEITLSEANLTEIGNSGDTPAEITLELWTKETGYTQGTDSSYATVTIKTLFDAIDTKEPTAAILPFYWNGEGKDTEQNPLNSLYEGSRENGHVEIAPISDIGNTYSSVSGKVNISGIAYDNIQLDKIQAVLPNHGGDVTVTATRTSGTKNWTSDKAMSPDGASLTVTTVGIDYRGYYVKWRLDWDTSKADVGTDKAITVTAIDGAAKTSPLSPTPFPDPYVGTGVSTNSTPITRGTPRTAENDLFIGKKRGQFVVFKDGEKQYLTRLVRVAGNKVDLEDSVPTEAVNAYMYEYEANRTKIAVNVVPYITGIQTALSKLGGENDPDLYARTALGRYPVKNGETITIKGFNLTGAQCTVGGSAEMTLAGTASPWTLALATDAKSGELTAKVTKGTPSVTIAAINNKNGNEKPYNKKAKTANNDKLTDDVELDVWEFNSEAAKPVRGTIAEPVMRINPINGIIGFAFANGPDYFSMSKGTDNSYIRWHKNSDDFRHIDFVYDNSGVSHGVVAAQDLNSASEQATNLDYITSRWGVVPDPQSGSNYSGDYALRLEKIGQIGNMKGEGGNILDKNRIQHPSLAVTKKGASNDTRLYLAYYDGINDQIRFKAGTLKSNMNWGKMSEGYYKNKLTNADTAIRVGTWKFWKSGCPKVKLPLRPFGQFVDEAWTKEIQKYNQDNVSIIAGKYMQSGTDADTGNKAGSYLSLAVVPGDSAADDVAALIWFDETSKKLKYTYNKYPAKEEAVSTALPNPPFPINDPGDSEVANLKFYTRTIPPRHFGSQTPGSGTPDGYWTAVKDVFTESNIGEYCKIVIDKNGGIHIAAYNFATADLHYAYLPDYGNTGSFKTSVVDSEGITGSDIRLDVALSENGKPIPYISYYSASAGCAKLAYLVEPASGFDQGAAGVENGYFTGKWEVTCIPTTSRVLKDNINVGVWKDTDGKITASTSAPSGLPLPDKEKGTVYGNGTANPVLSYAIKDSINGYIEMAQKK